MLHGCRPAGLSYTPQSVVACLLAGCAHYHIISHSTDVCWQQATTLCFVSMQDFLHKAGLNEKNVLTVLSGLKEVRFPCAGMFVFALSIYLCAA